MVVRPKSSAKRPDEIIVRRKVDKLFGIFIDGVELDRASKRMKRKIDFASLLKSLSAGQTPTIARYYTLLPQEDDSRHSAFLEAVAGTGLTVLSKRLPPKGITKQVSIAVEMAADMISFSLAREDFKDMSSQTSSGPFSIKPGKDTTANANVKSENRGGTLVSPHKPIDSEVETEEGNAANPRAFNPDLKIKIIVVCPSKELSYPLGLCNYFGATTVSADFGKYTGNDSLKSAGEWIDLENSETIWK